MGNSVAITSPETAELVKQSEQYVSRLQILEEEMKIVKATLAQLNGSEVVIQSKNDIKEEERIRVNVFISFHVASSLPLAQKLKQDFTEKLNCKVFICTEMLGGRSYRHQIIEAIESCQVIVPLICKGWSESAECMDEFNHARRLNLRSHVSHRTTAPASRLPVIVPIFYKDFDFTINPDTRLLASSVNFIAFQDYDLTWRKLCESIAFLKPQEFPFSETLLEMKGDAETPKKLLSTGSDIKETFESSGGTFIFRGQTINDHDGNTTKTDRCLITFANGLINGTVDYQAGTIYNASEVAPIQGTYDFAKNTFQWTELYHHKQSHFEYSGKIIDGKFIGTYYMRERPKATGKFEFKFERWL
jgi:flagellar basal body rod protein FlgB